MEREKIIQEAKAELERHVWGTFVEGKATVALGGTGVVVSVAKPAARDSEPTFNICDILPRSLEPRTGLYDDLGNWVVISPVLDTYPNYFTEMSKTRRQSHGKSESE